MPIFRLSRKVTTWEYCDIEAEDFDDALELADNGQASEYWDQIGDEIELIGITAIDENGEPGEDRDVENGAFKEANYENR